MITHSQETSLDPVIELFEIDLTNVGVDRQFFFQNSSTDPLIFNGNTYVWIDSAVDGISNSSSQQASPTLALTNVNREFVSNVRAFDDFNGGQLRYTRTFERFLNNNNGSERFSTAQFDIVQKLSQSRTTINFRLGTLLDRDSLMIPRRRATSTLFPGIGLVN